MIKIIFFFIILDYMTFFCNFMAYFIASPHPPDPFPKKGRGGKSLPVWGGI
jgi:heme/copper-type cytochrome/quinol oxidase subunit 3